MDQDTLSSQGTLQPLMIQEIPKMPTLQGTSFVLQGAGFAPNGTGFTPQASITERHQLCVEFEV